MFNCNGTFSLIFLSLICSQSQPLSHLLQSKDTGNYYSSWCFCCCTLLHLSVAARPPFSSFSQCYNLIRNTWKTRRKAEKQLLRRHRHQSSIAHDINHGWKTSPMNHFLQTEAHRIGPRPEEDGIILRTVHLNISAYGSGSYLSSTCIPFLFSNSFFFWAQKSSDLVVRIIHVCNTADEVPEWATDSMEIKSFIEHLCWF